MVWTSKRCFASTGWGALRGLLGADAPPMWREAPPSGNRATMTQVAERRDAWTAAKRLWQSVPAAPRLDHLAMLARTTSQVTSSVAHTSARLTSQTPVEQPSPSRSAEALTNIPARSPETAYNAPLVGCACSACDRHDRRLKCGGRTHARATSRSRRGLRNAQALRGGSMARSGLTTHRAMGSGNMGAYLRGCSRDACATCTAVSCLEAVLTPANGEQCRPRRGTHYCTLSRVPDPKS